jgi:hypothetical protein
MIRGFLKIRAKFKGESVRKERLLVEPKHNFTMED